MIPRLLLVVAAQTFVGDEAAARRCGYAIIDAKSREEALALARRFMDLHRRHWPTFEGECEVRPFEEEAQPAS